LTALGPPGVIKGLGLGYNEGAQEK